MKRHLRKMDAQPGLVRRRVDRDTGIEEILAATERHIVLELAGWKGSGDQVDLADPRLQAYYRIQAERGFLVIHEIWIGGILVASHLGGLDGERLMTLRFSYDERFSDLGPGNMVVLWAVKDAADHGCRTVDLGGTGIETHTYKANWTDRTYGVGQYGLYAPHLRGRLAALAIETAIPKATAIRRQVAALPERLRERIRPAAAPTA